MIEIYLPEALCALYDYDTLSDFASDLTIRLFRSNENSGRIFIKILDSEATMHYHCVILKKNRDRYARWITFLEERFS